MDYTVFLFMIVACFLAKATPSNGSSTTTAPTTTTPTTTTPTTTTPPTTSTTTTSTTTTTPTTTTTTPSTTTPTTTPTTTTTTPTTITPPPTTTTPPPPTTAPTTPITITTEITETSTIITTLITATYNTEDFTTNDTASQTTTAANESSTINENVSLPTSTTTSSTTQTSIPITTSTTTTQQTTTTRAPTTTTGPPPTTKPPVLGPVLGSIFGVLFCVGIGAAVFFCYRRRYGKLPCGERKDGTREYINLVSLRHSTKKFAVNGRPIAVEDLTSVLKEGMPLHAGFRDEHKSLPVLSQAEVTHACKEALREENKNKNRYINIFPYDASRVVLKRESDTDSDFINANFISDCNKANMRKYIAAQGPIDQITHSTETVADFWRMIWDYDIDIIVMLTSLAEKNSNGVDITKCARYWPEEKDCYGNITVAFESEKTYCYFTVRKFRVTKENSNNVRCVKQFHYTHWRDYSAVPDCGPLLKMRKLINKEHTNSSPILVHCSAGVGRTGTYIMIDQMIREGEKSSCIDVLKYAVLMRTQRMYMIQTENQYVFTYLTLEEYFDVGDTSLHSDQILELSENTLDKEALHKQFQKLESMKVSYNENDCATSKTSLNRKRNRDTKVVPPEIHLLYLEPDRSGNSPYINAIRIQGYSEAIFYYVTQIPLSSTTQEFWRLVYEYGCGSVVCLEDLIDGTKWLPTWEEPLNLDDRLHVQVTAEKTSGAVAVKEINIQYRHVHEPEQQIYENTTFHTNQSLKKKKKQKKKEKAKQEQEEDTEEEQEVEQEEEQEEEEQEEEEQEEEEEEELGDTQPNAAEVNLKLFKIAKRETAEGGFPCLASDICEFYTAVKSLHSISLYNGPTVVMCRNAVYASGLYIASAILLDQLGNENEVNVFQAVKQVRMTQPHFIPTEDQYILLHEVVSCYKKATMRHSVELNGRKISQA